jgi:hypothetical protein
MNTDINSLAPRNIEQINALLVRAGQSQPAKMRFLVPERGHDITFSISQAEWDEGEELADYHLGENYGAADFMRVTNRMLSDTVEAITEGGRDAEACVWGARLMHYAKGKGFVEKCDRLLIQSFKASGSRGYNVLINEQLYISVVLTKNSSLDWKGFPMGRVVPRFKF